MNGVNKTLYIPLYGKAYVSQKGLFLKDRMAEEIWKKEQFSLKKKSASKWLAYNMGIRGAVFDDWLRRKMAELPNAVVIHIGCGMDSRVLRVGTGAHPWYDVDFAQVIQERKRYFTETPDYRMIAGDVREGSWLDAIAEAEDAIIVLEGVSMYLTQEELRSLVQMLTGRFGRIYLLMDCYTEFAAKASRYKNPINDVGVDHVYGIDQPERLNHGSFHLAKEMEMIPQQYVRQLHGVERKIFKMLFTGKMYRKLYRLYEFRSE